MLGAEACSTTPPFRFFCFARHVEEEIAFLVNSFLFKLWLKHLCEKRPRGGGEKTEEPYHRDHLGGGGWSVRDILWDVFLARFWGFFIFEISRGRNERDICKDKWILLGCALNIIWRIECLKYGNLEMLLWLWIVGLCCGMREGKYTMMIKGSHYKKVGQNLEFGSTGLKK